MCAQLGDRTIDLLITNRIFYVLSSVDRCPSMLDDSSLLRSRFKILSVVVGVKNNTLRRTVGLYFRPALR